VDLSDVNTAVELLRKLKPDVVVSSPPCQDFYNAGNGGTGERAALTVAFAEIVAAVKPQYFAMENVAPCRTSPEYAEARDIIKAAGYGLSETVLDASLCGVPQSRRRFFCIGVLGDADGVVLPYLVAGLSEKPMTVRDYLGSSFEYYYTRNRYHHCQSIHSVDVPAPTVTRTGNNLEGTIPAGYTGNTKDPVSVTDPRVHVLTTLERAAIQTFPADYNWGNVPKELQELMIGNAVPPKLAEVVARALLTYDKSREPIGSLDTDVSTESTRATHQPSRIYIGHGGGAMANNRSECVEDLAFAHLQSQMNEAAYKSGRVTEAMYNFAKEKLHISIEKLTSLCYPICNDVGEVGITDGFKENPATA
jgi:DNA (cytosine-5)-methyltransferase 1